MKLKRNCISILTMLLGVFMLSIACQHKELSPLEQLIKDESRNKEINKDLLFGISLGMEKQAFFDYCAKKNDTEEFMDGGRYHQVLVEIEDGFTEPVDFWFWQEFKDNKLFRQENKFKYKSWSPWNKDSFAKHLLPEVISYLEPHFGADFIKIEAPNNQLHYVDIDGNRRIDVYTKLLDDAYVYMDVKELRK